MFIINFTGEKQNLPEELAGEKDLLTGTELPETIKPYDVFLIRRD